MASNQEEPNTANTPFPDPPIYWQSFTTDNLASYEAYKGTAVNEDQSHTPGDLVNLSPPIPPAHGEYNIFGDKRSLTAPQKDLPEETPSLQPKTGTEASPEHLLNLTRSLMLSYLELLHIMAINPEPAIYGIKWEDLRDLFKNAHHGLNTYRPWQARDTLIRLLVQTRDDARAEIQGVKNLKTTVSAVFEDVAQNCEQTASRLKVKADRDVDVMNGIHTNGYKKTVPNGIDDSTGIQELQLWSLINENSED